MAAWFITATGTDVGKTFVTAGLARELKRRGCEVEILKPVITGFSEATAAASDPARLLAAMERPATPAAIAAISPWRYLAPLSPHLAAAREGKKIDFDAVVRFCMGGDGIRLIEGVGGVMVPLDDRHTVLDLIAALRIPAILVAGSYLGTFSHTLTALAALRQRQVEVAAVVISESLYQPLSLAETTASLAAWVQPARVLSVIRQDPPSPLAFAALADALGF